MSEQPRRDREWEHWPQERRLDDGIRHRLRGLFHPTTHGDEAVEELLAHSSRELEQRAAELAATIGDLERREQRTHELRSAVEQMLRRGSAELDERHAELTELAARLAERESVVAQAEAALAERRRELGAVELRRAAVERREAAAGEREDALERRSADLAERERLVADVEQRATELVTRSADVVAREERLTRTLETLDHDRADVARRAEAVEERERHFAALEERERALAHAAATVAAREAAIDSERTTVDSARAAIESDRAELDAARTALEGERASIEGQREELRQAVTNVSAGLGLGGALEPDSGEAGHLLFVPGERYRLVEADGPVPQPDTVVELEEGPFRVVRVGPSPLPGDRRRCARLERYSDSGTR